MKTIAIIGQKGGSGKTTIATALAVRAVRDKKSVALIDLDPQGTATKWGEIRGQDTPAIVSCQIFMLSKMLTKAKEGGADIAIIDTPGKIENATLAAAKSADITIIPVRATAFDLNALAELRNLLAIAGDPQSYVVINAAPPQGRRHEDAKAVIESMHALIVAPVHLCQRNAYADATISGLTVTEYEPEGKAALEIDALYNFVFSKSQNLKRKSKKSNGKVNITATS
jgi:chromosome partitioning protein